MSSTSRREDVYADEKMRASNKNLSHLSMTIIFTEADLDELWLEGLQTGEITCQSNDSEYIETWH